MGGESSSRNQEQLRKIQAQYDFIKDIKDPVLGKIKYLKHKETS